MNDGGMYDYQGSIRLQLWFETPNQAAAFLAMLVFACLALAAFFDSSGKNRAATIGARFYLGGKITAIALSCLCSVLIALTYSRGGYLSLFGAGLFALGILRLRVWILIPAIIAFAIAIGVIPSGGDRLSQSVPTGKDASVGNRVLLWQNTSALIADNWQSGVGADEFHDTYTKYYQNEYATTRYRNAVNDLLTLGAYYGIWAPFLYLGAVSYLLTTGTLVAVRRRDALLGYLLSAIASFLVSGLFSMFVLKPQVSWLFGGLCLAAALRISFLERIFLWKTGRFAAIASAIAAALFATGALAYGTERLNTLSFAPLNENPIRSIDTIGLRPRFDSSKGLFIYISDKEDPLLSLNSDIRQFAKAGYRCIALSLSSWGKGGVVEIQTAIAEIVENDNREKQNLYLAGHGEGARLALVAATDMESINGVIALASPAKSPFKSLSPTDRISKLKCPVFLAHGVNDTNVPVADSRTLARLAKARGKAVGFLELPGDNHYVKEKWGQIIEEAVDFFDSVETN